MHSSDSSALDLPLPLRNFAGTRRILLMVLAASILFPVAFLLGYGYYDYQRRMEDADDIADRIARVADEHASKVLDLNRQMSMRVVEMLGNSDDARIHANQKPIHERLSEIGESFAHVAGITVFGATGDMLASNRFYPVPSISIGTRDDFVNGRAIRPEPYFSLPLVGKIAQSDVFTTSVGRSASRRTFPRIGIDRAEARIFLKLLQRFIERRSGRDRGTLPARRRHSRARTAGSFQRVPRSKLSVHVGHAQQ